MPQARRARSYVHSVVAQAVGGATSFASFILLARLLSPTDLGAWVLFLTIAGLFEMLRAGVVQTPFVVYYSAAESEAARTGLEGAAWTVAGACTSVLAAAALLLAGTGDGGWRDLISLYPALAVASLPSQIAAWRLQALAQFGRLVCIRLAIGLGFLTVAVLAAVAPDRQDPLWIATGYVVVHGLVSAATLALGWARVSPLLRRHRREMVRLVLFGRFSVGTMLGSNLLRSTDALLLGWLVGPAAVAIYAVPQKLLEVVEVPLRGLVQAAYPDLGRQHLSGGLKRVKRRTERWVLWLMVAVALVLPVPLVFAESVVTLVAGPGYGESAGVLRVFALYALLLPADRFLGVVLDVIDRPDLNLAKVAVMVIANMVGDLIVILNGGGLVAVAAVSVAMTAIGIGLGVGLIHLTESRSPSPAPA